MELDVLEKSKTYMNEGQLEKAQVLLRRALHDNPDDARALELAGDLAQRMGKKEDALGQYERASRQYVDKGRHLQAIICLEKIIKLEGTNSDRYVALAHLYRQSGLPNQAIQRIIELCSWAVENKDETTFITGLRKIVELQPQNLKLGLSYARILSSMNRGEQAEEELKRLKDLASEQNDDRMLEEIDKMLPQADGGDEELDPKSRVELGNLLYEIGSKEEAIVEFNRAVSDLIEQGETEEAVTVLNRILEVDPGNEAAQGKLGEIQGVKIEQVKEEIEKPDAESTESEIRDIEETDRETGVLEVEEIKEEGVEAGVTAEEAGPVEESAEEAVEEPAEVSEPAADIFDDLIREVETYVESAQGKSEPKPKAAESEEPQTLEGQIADIEFLLKEMEAPPTPSFEIATEFDDFRGNIMWEEEDVGRRLDLARRAFAAELYETALTHARELKINKNTWPLSLELTGAALIKLGKYSEAIKTVGPAILLEDIPQAEKVELRYLLASAYEGLGDFENALREIEHIVSTNPNYKDVREMYELLGGKGMPEPPETLIEEKPLTGTETIEREGATPVPQEPVERTTEESHTAEPKPKTTDKEKAEEMPEPEYPGENISFL
ncbi:MAG: tetratricopeptide repeat protein [candidate division WOR-3 bacterium]|jgi:tetratricopeptide (TPR) repeat protein